MSAISFSPDISRLNLVANFDATAYKSYSPNVIPYPIDLFSWCGSATDNACVVTQDTSITRQLGSIPLKMAITGNDPYISTFNSNTWNLANATAGETWTLSVYAKASQTTTAQLFLFGAANDGTAIENNNTTINLTTSWQRFTLSYTISNISVFFIQARLDGTPTSGSGITIWWDGMQVEKSSSATRFNPSYNGNTIWKDLTSNRLTGTLTNGPVFNSEKTGCISFDGTNDTVTVSHSSILNFTKLTFLGFIKTPSSYTSSYRAIISKQGADRDFNFYLLSSASNGVIDKYHFSSARIAGYGSTANMPGGSLALNTWHQVGFSVGSGRINYILNGNIIFSETYTGTFNANNTYALNIGSADNYFLGSIASILLYNRVITTAEINKHYQTFKTKYL